MAHSFPSFPLFNSITKLRQFSPRYPITTRWASLGPKEFAQVEYTEDQTTSFAERSVAKHNLSQTIKMLLSLTTPCALIDTTNPTPRNQPRRPSFSASTCPHPKY